MAILILILILILMLMLMLMLILTIYGSELGEPTTFTAWLLDVSDGVPEGP